MKVTATVTSSNSFSITNTEANHEEDKVIPINYKLKGFNPTNEDIVVKQYSVSDGDLDFVLDSPSDTKYIRESYRLTINSNISDADVPNIQCTSSEDRVKVLIEGTNISFYTDDADGITAITSEITLNVPGYNIAKFNLAFKGLEQVTVTPDNNNVPYDFRITLTINNYQEGMQVSTDSVYMHADIIEEDGVYKVICIASQAVTGKIILYGRTIADYEYNITFTDKDNITLTCHPEDANVFINEEITITVTGTTRPIEASSNNDVIKVSVQDYTVKVVSAEPAKGTITIYGDGIMAKTKTVNVKALQDLNPTVTPSDRNVYVGQYITFEFNGIERSEITHEVTDNTDGKITVEESVSNPKALLVKSSGEVSSRAITFKANNYNDYTTNVTFKEKDIISVTEGNSIEKYLDDDIVLNVTGTENALRVESDDPDTATVSITGKVIKVSPKKAGTINITISGEGVESIVVGVTIKELKEMVISGTGKETAKYNKEITVSVTEPSSNVSYEMVSSPSSSISVRTSGNDFILSTTKVSSGTLTLKAQNYKPKQVSVTFEDLDIIEATISPKNIVKKGEKITINVTKPINGSGITTDKTGTINVEDKTNGVFEVTSADPVSGTVTLKADGYKDKVFNVRFEEYDELLATITPSTLQQVNEDIVVTFTSDTTSEITYEVTSEPASSITVEKDSSNSKLFRIKSSVAATGKVTFKSDKFLDKVLNVQFQEEPVIQDEISISCSPSNRVVVGNTITAKVTGTEKEISASSSDSDVKVSVQDKIITITATDPASAIITVTGLGVITKQFNVEFIEKEVGPQFSVDDTNITFNESDVYTDIKINNLVGKLKATCTSKLLDLSLLENDILRIELLEQIKDTLTATITLSVEGQSEVVLNVKVVNDIEQIPTMSIDGKTITTTVGKEVYVIAPTPDVSSSVKVNAPSEVTSRVDIDRIYLKSDTEGTYTITVELTGYKTATLTFKVGIPATVITPADKVYYDLGSAPKVEIVYNKDNFVDKVFEDTKITNDKERLAYVLENGDTDVSSTANALCKYQEVMSKNTTKDLTNMGGQYNFMLYARLMSVINSEEYYTFRSSLKVILKIFKLYKDDAFNVLNLNRFELKWPSDSVKLEEYKLLVTFLAEYVSKNGAGISANPLPFSPEVKSRFNRFIQEGFRP